MTLSILSGGRRKAAAVALSVVAAGGMVVATNTTASADVTGACYRGEYEIYGSRGHCVEHLQTLLNHHAHAHPELRMEHLAVDGIFGRATERNVAKAKRSLGLNPYNKLVGPTTWDRLNHH